MHISLNGQIITEEPNNTVSISDPAVWFDFGVYESIKVVQGKVFHLNFHVERLFKSAEIIDLNLGFTKEQVKAWIKDFATHQKLRDNLIRLCAYGDVAENKKAKVYMFAVGLTFYPNNFYTTGVKAITYSGERFLPQAKSMNLLLGFLALREAKKQGALEALLINNQGLVTEGTRSNLFIVEKGEIITPPKAVVLPGTSQMLVEQVAGENNISIKYEPISKERLTQAEEVFVTSTSMNIMPIVEINGAAIAQGRVGTLTARLDKLYRKKQRDF